MGLFGIGTHNNARIAQGLDYENFRSLAFDATDNVRSGGEIGGRAVRLTQNGMGIATTRSDGRSGARAGQVSGAREAFLAAVERKFGINARLTASRMMDTEGVGKPLTSRVIKAIDEKINPFTHSLKPTQFVASQRAVFDRALQDASTSLAHLDAIRSLKAGESYYLSNTTGEIKKADAWQKFKCLLGVGDGRQKAAKLVAAVKDALLDSTGRVADANLEARISDFNQQRSRFTAISGRALAELAANFTTANAGDIARVQAAAERLVM